MSSEIREQVAWIEFGLYVILSQRKLAVIVRWIDTCLFIESSETHVMEQESDTLFQSRFIGFGPSFTVFVRVVGVGSC